MTTLLPIRATLCIAWLLSAAAGMKVILDYENTAGRSGKTPERWPARTEIALDSSRDTLVMFAHPRCPCTRTSLEELNHLLAQSRGQVAVHVVFFKPDNYSDGWTRTDLWRSASAIPGVRVNEDVDGALARQFGAETSGYVVLYDPQGQLLFQGGITAGRGHAGDNVGEKTIVSLLAGQNPDHRQTPVYGCSLLNKVCSRQGIAR